MIIRVVFLGTAIMSDIDLFLTEVKGVQEEGERHRLKKAYAESLYLKPQNVHILAEHTVKFFDIVKLRDRQVPYVTLTNGRRVENPLEPRREPATRYVDVRLGECSEDVHELLVSLDVEAIKKRRLDWI